MATYGPGRRSNQRSTSRSGSSRSSGSGSSRSDRSGAIDRTDRYDRVERGGRRGQASAELREAIGGREHEFGGVGLIVAGILIGLAVYLDVAGPLGRGVEQLIGWFTGLGRFVVPIALIGAGAALVHRGRSDNRPRLVLGYLLAALAVLGLLQRRPLEVGRRQVGLAEVGAQEVGVGETSPCQIDATQVLAPTLHGHQVQTGVG